MLNKRILGVILLVVGLAGVLYFGNLFLFKDKGENTQIEKNEDESIEEDREDSQNKEAGEPTDIAVGELAPDFTLVNLEGKEVALSDFKGKYVFLNFWATWCKFCDIEMPDLDDIDKNNEDIVVLAVNVQEEQDKVKSYIEKGDYGFEVVLDEKGDISRKYLVSGYPTTYFVNKEGILMGGVPAMMTRPQMDQVIESLRAE